MKRTDDDAFRRQLHDAGVAVTPPTSEQLHARVMASVRRERATSSAALTGGRASGWWWTIGALAAVVAVIMTGWLTTSREPNPPPVVKRDVPSLPAVPSIENVVVKRVDPVRTKLHEARFAYLDRDTKRLAKFLVRAVPMPSEAKAAVEREATPSSASGT